ncbi:hypothetical protein [Nannocystis pusilla]|uniref:hypothetical protein n=1 Tax=Nannocystis pusilla TaxID=889268 RepID=UPI003DA22FDF
MAVTDSESPEMRRALAPGGTLDALPDDFDVLGARYSGKVRENFTRGGERLILVTDRVSAFERRARHHPVQGPGAQRPRALLVRRHRRDLPQPHARRP